MTNIGLIGYGCVGQGFHHIIKDKQLPVTIRGIGVKDRSKLRTEKLSFTFDPEDLIRDPLVKIIIEAIDDPVAALLYAVETLKQGKTLITANKKMVAENLVLLKELEEQYGGCLLYEAAVCGGIPVIQLLKDYFKNENILSIEGILNGSSNYILTRMGEAKISYHEALEEAQNKGFAEADPTLDVEGYDAANKLSILSFEAFGQQINPDEIARKGIESVKLEDVISASADRKKYKLMASLYLANGHLKSFVKPELIDYAHPLYHVDYEYNAVVVKGEFAGNQILYGKGAGSLPTGLAVAGDLLQALKVQKSLALV